MESGRLSFIYRTPQDKEILNMCNKLYDEIDYFKSVYTKNVELVKYDKAEELCENGEYYLIKLNDKTIGFYSVIESIWSNDLLILMDLYIKPSYRNKGLGSQALAQIKNNPSMVSNYKYLQVTTTEKTLNFYRRHGFNIPYNYNILAQISQEK